jgi:hypothetical protein
MAQPYEADIGNATAAWNVWIAMAAGNLTVASAHSYMNEVVRRHTDPGSPLDADWSIAFVNRGVTYLKGRGFASESGGNLTALQVTASGAPRRLKRQSNGIDLTVHPSGLPEKTV